jgi:hypothetical protein
MAPIAANAEARKHGAANGQRGLFAPMNAGVMDSHYACEAPISACPGASGVKCLDVEPPRPIAGPSGTPGAPE